MTLDYQHSGNNTAVKDRKKYIYVINNYTIDLHMCGVNVNFETHYKFGVTSQITPYSYDLSSDWYIYEKKLWIFV